MILQETRPSDLGVFDPAALPEQFDIMVAGACNAKCAFCVQEATYKAQNVKRSEFLSGLQRHFDEFYHAGGRRVVITGGEPTLFMDRTLGVLDVLHSYPDLEVKAVYTNGIRLLEPFKGKKEQTITEVMAARGLQDVNLSVHHYLDRVNNEILQIGSKSPTAKIAQHVLDCGLKLRVNLTLQKGGVCKFEDFIQYVETAFSWGASDIYVRELFQFSFSNPLGKTERDAIDVSRKRYVGMLPIISQAIASGEFERLYQVKETFREKTEICLLHHATGKRVYFAGLIIGTEQQNAIPYLVYMPNGRLYKGWLGKKDEIASIKYNMICDLRPKT